MRGGWFLARLAHGVAVVRLSPGECALPGRDLWDQRSQSRSLAALDASPAFTAAGGDRSEAASAQAAPGSSTPACSPSLGSARSQPRAPGKAEQAEPPVSRRQWRVLREPLSHPEPAATALPEPLLKASKNNPRSISDSSV